MPRRGNKRGNRRGGRRFAPRRGGTGLPYRYQESGHGTMQAGSTTQISVPDHLPVNRQFRPLSLTVHAVSRNSTAHQVIQVRAINQLGQSIATWGPMTVGSTTLRLHCGYPSREPNWPDTTSTKAIVWAIDNLCLQKGDTSHVVYTESTLWAFGREFEGEACPTRITTVEGSFTIPSLCDASQASCSWEAI